MSSDFLFSFALLIILVAVSLALHFRRQANYRKFNFEWYRREFPNLITARGVKCYKCGSDHMVVRNLMQGSYTKAHSCGRCGQTLYYSPE